MLLGLVVLTHLAVKLMTLSGAVTGVLKGVLKVDKEIEVRPGIVSRDREGKLMCLWNTMVFSVLLQGVLRELEQTRTPRCAGLTEGRGRYSMQLELYLRSSQNWKSPFSCFEGC